MDVLAPALALGLPAAASMVVLLWTVDRLLRFGERRGIIIHPRRWNSAGIGNALLELHLAFRSEPARIELQLEDEDQDAIGDGRTDEASNVIAIDFVRRRRVHVSSR